MGLFSLDNCQPYQGSGFKMLISETLYAIVWIGGFNPSQNNKFQATSTKIQNHKPVWIFGY